VARLSMSHTPWNTAKTVSGAPMHSCVTVWERTEGDTPEATIADLREAVCSVYGSHSDPASRLARRVCRSLWRNW
jgi:hypothetical protein